MPLHHTIQDKLIRHLTVSFDFETSGTISLGTFSANTRILYAILLQTDDAFDAVGASISMGTSGNPTEIFGTSLFDLTNLSGQESFLGNIIKTAGEYLITVNPGTGGTIGAHQLEILYVDA